MKEVPEIPESLAPDQKLAFATQLFKQYYAACFWHLKPDLAVSQETLPLIIKGLRRHGGRDGMVAAAKLEA